MRGSVSGRHIRTAALSVLVVALAGAEVPLDRAAHALSVSNTGFAFLICAAFASVGLLLTQRLPRNPIGWLLVAFAIIVLCGDCAGDYSQLAYNYGHRSLPLAGPVAIIATVAAVAPILLLALPILLFPDARLSSRWRWMLRVYSVACTAFLLGLTAASLVAITQPHVQVSGSGTLVLANSPRGPTAAFAALKLLAVVFVAPMWISTLVRQVVSYRRSSGLERLQLKWLVAGGAGSLTAVVFFVTGGGSGNSALSDVLSTIFGTLFAALPVSMGIAILRYRLYELDRLISRTLSYAILTALLVGIFIALIALTTNTLALSGRVGVAASTLAAAALFNPLRIRVQRSVDRRFNRARYDAEATVAAFTARLRDAVEIDAIRADLLGAVNHAVEPSYASVWIKP